MARDRQERFPQKPRGISRNALVIPRIIHPRRRPEERERERERLQKAHRPRGRLHLQPPGLARCSGNTRKSIAGWSNGESGRPEERFACSRRSLRKATLQWPPLNPGCARRDGHDGENERQRKAKEERATQGLYYTAITVALSLSLSLSHTHTHIHREKHAHRHVQVTTHSYRVEGRAHLSTYGHRRTSVRSPVYLQEIYSCRHASGSGRRYAGVRVCRGAVEARRRSGVHRGTAAAAATRPHYLLASAAGRSEWQRRG